MTQLIAPPSDNPYTGGYIYNKHMSDYRIIRYRYVSPSPAEARKFLKSVDEATGDAEKLILLDSLYIFHPAMVRALNGFRCAALLHYLPSEAPGLASSKRFELRALENRFLRNMIGYIATSRYTRNRLVRRGIDPEMISVAAPGIDKDTVVAPGVDRSGPPELPHKLITVAALTPTKGQRFLLDILGRFKRYTWRWYLVGSLSADIEHTTRFMSNVRSAGLEERIVTPGSVSPDRVRAFLRESDLFVFPSFFEAYGIAPAESIAAGVPVIAHRCGGIHESIRHGFGASFIRTGYREGWHNRLEEVFSSRAIYRRLQRGCAAGQGFLRTWDDTAHDFRAAISRLKHG